MGYATVENSGATRAILPHKGDRFYFQLDEDDSLTNYSVGEKLYDGAAVVTKVYYRPKKWWQFWKKKTLKGYEVEWLKDTIEYMER